MVVTHVVEVDAFVVVITFVVEVGAFVVEVVALVL